ncbi:MAG: transposase [bacterium]|nr:transposase [bacterium]
MASRNNIELGEWHHCYNRGVDKRPIFSNEGDANRFMMLLYLCNSSGPVALYNMHKPDIGKAFGEERGSPIVSIGAFCLMPNHYHLLIKEIIEGGTTSFMRKLGTAYTMYFNQKFERIGHLFCGQYRSRHVASDEYFQTVLPYIHINPAELYEPNWKDGTVRDLKQLQRKLIEYPYSSLSDYANPGRTSPILGKDGFEIARPMSVSKMLREARDYHVEQSKENFER